MLSNGPIWLSFLLISCLASRIGVGSPNLSFKGLLRRETGRAFGEIQKLKPGASELFICIAMGLIVTQQAGSQLTAIALTSFFCVLRPEYEGAPSSSK
jgi:hypothetical protein